MLAESNELIVEADEDDCGNVMVEGVVLSREDFDRLFTPVPEEAAN
ncbi:MAG: hypothetical protein AAGJ46_21565 [Planctomycetota bacterium]